MSGRNPLSPGRSRPFSTPTCYVEDIVDALDMANDMVTHYLDRRTGEVIPITEDALIAAESEEGVAGGAGLDEAELELVRRISSGDSADYIELPSRFEVNEYRIIEQFVERQTDDRVYGQLSDAIRGRGAFRRFKDAIRRLGIEEEWYAYREVRFLEIAEAWCEEHGIVAKSRRKEGT